MSKHPNFNVQIQKIRLYGMNLIATVFEHGQLFQSIIIPLFITK